MQLLSAEIVQKIKSLPPEKQDEVINGIARILAERATARDEGLRDKNRQH